VRTGRNALRRWTSYPWYNAQEDEIQPVKVDAPAKPEPERPSGKSMFAGLAGLLRVLVWTILALVIGVLVFVLLRTFMMRQRERDMPEATDAGDAARIESLPFPVAAGRMDLLAEARRQYQAGNYGAAIVYLFSFQLVQLDRRQIIRLAKGKTNRQYMREVGPRDSLRSLVQQTMVVFEDVFFGNRELRRERFESCWTRLNEFETLTGEAGMRT
jgi:hypothetical protein